MQSEQLIDTLKRALKSRKKTYAQIAQGIGLSESSVKRLFARRSFSLNTLEAICELIGLDFYDLARLARQASESQGVMSIAQEDVLAEQPKLLGIFYLAYNDWQTEDILRRYHLTKPELLTLLLGLEKIKLIDLLPGDIIRLRVSRPIRVRPDGPIRKKLGQAAVDDFLSVRYGEKNGIFRFEFRELSTASFELMQRKIERLVGEFHELAEMDILLPQQQKQSCGFVQCVRPWHIERISGLVSREVNNPDEPPNLK